jgi:hypothetical protein
MPRIHWVARQYKLEIPKEKDQVNKRDVHDPKAADPKARGRAWVPSSHRAFHSLFLHKKSRVRLVASR